MAQLIGGLATSHIPAIGGAIHKGKQQDPYWKPFFDGFPPISHWLAQVKPDTVVVFYNDHGLNFFLDKMPTFAVGAAPEYRNADEGWGIPTTAPLPGNLDLSWHLINHLIEREFDIVTCQEMLIDHACTLPFKLFWWCSSSECASCTICERLAGEKGTASSRNERSTQATARCAAGVQQGKVGGGRKH